MKWTTLQEPRARFPVVALQIALYHMTFLHCLMPDMGLKKKRRKKRKTALLVLATLIAELFGSKITFSVTWNCCLPSTSDRTGTPACVQDLK